MRRHCDVSLRQGQLERCPHFPCSQHSLQTDVVAVFGESAAAAGEDCGVAVAAVAAVVAVEELRAELAER